MKKDKKNEQDKRKKGMTVRSSVRAGMVGY